MKIKDDNFMKIILIFLVIIFICFFSYTIYFIGFDNGYYEAKEDAYCHRYCFDNFAYNGINIVNDCHNKCINKNSYTNLWKYIITKSEGENDGR